jgi:ABC-type multidrug transport system fused ATPase/permease subunit
MLLDDPVSALDAEVGKKVFNEVIKGVCKGKTIIMATHAVDFFRICDRILILEKGKVKGFGSYEQL